MGLFTQREPWILTSFASRYRCELPVELARVPVFFIPVVAEGFEVGLAWDFMRPQECICSFQSPVSSLISSVVVDQQLGGKSHAPRLQLSPPLHDVAL